MNQPTHRRTRPRRKSPTLPELEQAKAAVLNSLASLQSRRSYRRAMKEFIAWYCSEPRLALNRSVVLRYRLRLENMRLAAGTINVRLAAVRRLANEAADSGLLSPDLIAGIRRVRGVKQLGRRIGNWLTPKAGQRLLNAVRTDSLRGNRDAAMLGLLIGCGLRRSELVELNVDQIQQREEHWVILDLIGKGGHVRTVPMPGWVKDAVDEWVCSAEITEGRLFRAIRKNGVLWGHGLTQNVVWYVVKECAKRAGIHNLAPHDLRRSCARMCHESGGELEQIQFLLGHASVLTTERYIGCKQRLSRAVNDRIALHAVSAPSRDPAAPTMEAIRHPRPTDRRPVARPEERVVKLMPMAKYRQRLPQLDGGVFVTDGGMETTLIFHEGLQLPDFAAFDLLKGDKGIEALRKYYRSYGEIARKFGVGFIIESATWRANADWGRQLGYSEEALAEANRKAIELCREIREEFETPNVRTVISGCIGPRGDGYSPDALMSEREAEDYHRMQAEIFRDSDADVISAMTMTYPEEAIGVTRAAQSVGMPAVISFTVETDGRLPNGRTLEQAIRQVDEATGEGPAYYMINCAHPTHFRDAWPAGAAWVERIRGLRANASTKSHAELDEAKELDEGDPTELALQYRDLKRAFRQLNVFGGCCGTDHRHVEAICQACVG